MAWTAALLLGSLTFLVYGPVLGTYFIADDFAWYIRQYTEFGERLVTHTGYMRPIGVGSVQLERLLLGESPVVPHVTNALFHLGSTALVYALTSRVATSRRAGFAAAILFALHPMHSPTVSWISARFDLLFTLFLLAGLLQYDTYRRSGGWAPLAGSLVMFTLALFSKETALCAPLLAIALDFASGRRPRVRTAVPFGVLWVAYLALRYQMFGGLGGKVKDGVSLQFQTSVSEFLMGIFVHPGLALLRPVNDLWWGRAALWLEIALVAATVVALAAAIRTSDRRARVTVLFGLAFLWIASVPTADRLGHGLEAGIVNGRYLYLPGVGFCIALGALLGSARRPTTHALAVLSALYLVTLAGNNLAWRKAGQLSGIVVREADRIASSRDVARPILIVQDLPRVQDGTILFMKQTIRNALRFNGHELIRVIEVPDTDNLGLRREVPDLRYGRRPNRVLAADWDAATERLEDRTEIVRAQLAEYRDDDTATREWRGADLAEWLARPDSASEGRAEVGEEGVRFSTKRGQTLLTSPPLPRGTRLVEVRLVAHADPAAPATPARNFSLGLSWRTLPDRRPSGVERRVDSATASCRQDGDEHVLTFLVEIRRLEDLAGTELECQLESLSPPATVEVRSIRVHSGPRALPDESD